MEFSPIVLKHSFRTHNSCSGRETPLLLVHTECKGELFQREGPVQCEICGRDVRREEILVVDDSPSTFSG